MNESPTTYLAAYTAAHGDGNRWNSMALDFYRALKEATGRVPASLMASGNRSAGLFLISGPKDAQIVYSAVVRRLSKPLWDFHAVDPDRVLVIEVARNAVGSDAVVQTAARMR